MKTLAFPVTFVARLSGGEKVFQRLETFFPIIGKIQKIFPIVGKLAKKFSNRWKIRGGFSNHWKIRVLAVSQQVVKGKKGKGKKKVRVYFVAGVAVGNNRKFF